MDTHHHRRSPDPAPKEPLTFRQRCIRMVLIWAIVLLTPMAIIEEYVYLKNLPKVLTNTVEITKEVPVEKTVVLHDGLDGLTVGQSFLYHDLRVCVSSIDQDNYAWALKNANTTDGTFMTITLRPDGYCR